MSAQSPSSAKLPTSEIVDLTENMSDLDADEESGAEESKGSGETKDVPKPRKKRIARRGTRSKKGKEPASLNKLQDGKAAGANQDALSLDSSRALSAADTVATEPLTASLLPRKLPKLLERVPVPSDANYVPVQPYYRIGEISDGNTGSSSDTAAFKLGVVATQPIDAGARIISEAPMITLPVPGDQVVELVLAFEDLSAHDQARIWSLNPVGPQASPFLAYMSEKISGKLTTLKRIANMPEDTRTEDEQDTLDDQFPKLANAAKIFRLAARWHASRCSLVNSPEERRNQIPFGTPVTGLFVETVRLRHSCVPNCYSHYNPATNLMNVHAVKAIDTGEELTLSAISSLYYQNASDRAEELKSRFGITCTCEACSRLHHKFKKHENMRLLAYARAVQLEHFLTLVDIVDDNHVATDLCLHDFDGSLEPEFEDLHDAEYTALALIKSLKTTTKCDAHPELIRWYNALVDRIQPRITGVLETDGERLRWWRIMLSHALECEKIALRCFGKDSTEYKELRIRREGMETKIKVAADRQEVLKQGKKNIGLSKKQLQILTEKQAKAKRQKEEEEEEEWEIVGTMVKKEDTEVKNSKGKVVGMIGTYLMTKD